MVYINECIDVNAALKNPLNVWVIRVGSNSFQGISYGGMASPRLYLDIFFQIYGDTCLYLSWPPRAAQHR